MTIRQHLNSIEQSGFYSHLFTGETVSRESDTDRLMKAELSLAFPLLSDAGKQVLFLAWSAHRNHQLTSTATRGAAPGESHETAAVTTTEAESAFTTLQEAVEDLVEQERFTDEQVEFIAIEMLGIEKPVSEQE